MGQRIELRPLARRHRDVRQVLARGAVLVHVACCGQGVAGDRVARLVGRFVQGRFGHRLELAKAGALVAAVADQRHFALAGVQRHGGGEKVAHIRRAADHGGFAELGMDAQIFGHRQTGEEVVGRAGEQAIDIGQLQAGIGQRAVHRFAQNFERAATGGHGHAAQAGAHDGGRAAQRRYGAHAVASCGMKTSSLPLAGSSITRARTRMPMRTCSGGTPSMRDISRGPSARSTSATL